MRLPEIEHVLRAARAATGESEFVIFGSQAVLASFPDAPRYLTYSDELDIYSLKAPEKSDLIDGSIGELSLFHETYGYYAHGVSPETAVYPSSGGNEPLDWKVKIPGVQRHSVFIRWMSPIQSLWRTSQGCRLRRGDDSV